MLYYYYYYLSALVMHGAISNTEAPWPYCEVIVEQTEVLLFYLVLKESVLKRARRLPG